MIRISSIVIYALIISASTTYSQSSGIGWGIKGGLNMSGVQTDNILLVQNNSKLGWQAGVFSKSVVEGWGYLAEASIITMGSKQVVGDESKKYCRLFIYTTRSSVHHKYKLVLLIGRLCFFQALGQA